jgi:hypothetical protein
MKLIEKRTTVPALTEPGERDREGEITNAARAEFGRAAVDLGTPDRGLNDDRTDAVDTLANVMHWLHEQGIDPAPVLQSASRHFHAEKETVESRALSILRDAGIDARLQHTGGGIWVAEISSKTIPGRTVWVGDSEGEQGGPFFVSAFASAPPAEEIAALSGACRATQLPVRVRCALSQHVVDPPDRERKGREDDAR